MGIITVEQIVSVDGYAVESGAGLSFFDEFDRSDDPSDVDQRSWLASVDAILLGRSTYEMFNAFWPTVDSESDPVAVRINTLPKHVVTATLDEAPWGAGDEVEVHADGPVATAESLRDRYDSIVVWGSLDLTDALFDAGLVDVLRLRTVPVLIGAGRSFSPGIAGHRRLTLEHSTALSTGHVSTQYRVR